MIIHTFNKYCNWLKKKQWSVNDKFNQSVNQSASKWSTCQSILKYFWIILARYQLNYLEGVHLPEYILINSLAPGRPGCHFKTAIFNLFYWLIRYSNDNAPRWMPWDLTDDKSTLVQVMAWYRQATSHYLSQCWPRSMLPYGITMPQWVNKLFMMY